MQRIHASENSFIAYVDWCSNSNKLFVTFRKNGNQYSYDRFSQRQFDALKNSGNIGGYIARQVINSKKHTAKFEQIIPMAEIEMILFSHTKYYRNFLAR